MLLLILSATIKRCVMSQQALRLVLLLVLGFAVLVPSPTRSIASAALLSPSEQMLESVNRVRADAGLDPLVRVASLDAVAADRSGDMATRGYFSHRTPEGIDVFALMNERGIGFSTAGENLAQSNVGEDRAADVAIEGFLNSPSHRDNLLNSSFGEIGIGVAQTGGLIYFTLVFVG